MKKTPKFTIQKIFKVSILLLILQPRLSIADEKLDESTIFAEIISENLLEEITGSHYSIAAGFDFNHGKYNSELSSNVYYAPLTFRYDDGPWSFSLSTGYMRISAPNNSFLGPDGKPFFDDDGDDANFHEIHEGLGDLYFSTTYSINSLYDNQIYIDFTGRVKIPTADSSKNLGTGRLDFTAQIDISKIYGKIMPFAAAGYKILGKTPQHNLQNSFFFSLGASYYLTYDTSIGISYDYRQTATPGFQDPKEIYTYLNMQINKEWDFNLYGVFGLNQASPDTSLGFRVRYKF